MNGRPDIAGRLLDPTLTTGALCALLAFAVGMLAGREPELALVAAIGLALVMLTFADLAMGFAVVAFVSSFAVLTVGESEGFFSVWKVSATLLLLSWLALIATREDLRGRELFQRHPYFLYMTLLFLGWVFISVMWAQDSGFAVRAAFQFLGYLILLPVAYTALREPKHFRWFCVAFVAGAILSGLYGVAIGSYDAEGRLTGVGGGPNAIAMLGVAGFFLSLGLFSAWRGKQHLQVLALAFAGICALELFLTLSRGGLIGFGIALVLSLLLVSRGKGKLALVAVLGALTVVGYFGFLAPEESRERVTQIGSGSGRLDIWTVGWRMVEDKPVAGVGVGNFIPSVPSYVVRPGSLDSSELVLPGSSEPKFAHNTYLQMWAELGIVGLILFLAVVAGLVACTAAAARGFNRAGDRRMEALARSLFAAQIGILGMAFFESIALTHQPWLLLATGPPLLALARQFEG